MILLECFPVIVTFFCVFLLYNITEPLVVPTASYETINWGISCGYLRCSLWPRKKTESFLKICVKISALPCVFVPQGYSRRSLLYKSKCLTFLVPVHSCTKTTNQNWSSVWLPLKANFLDNLSASVKHMNQLIYTSRSQIISFRMPGIYCTSSSVVLRTNRKQFPFLNKWRLPIVMHEKIYIHLGSVRLWIWYTHIR